MVPASLAQGVGMLGMMMTMPAVMIYVYPTRLGMIHVLAFRLLRYFTVPEDGHSRSIRVDLVSTAAGWPFSEGRATSEAAAAAASTESGEHSPYSVHTVACLLDNYCYVIVDRSTPPPHPVALVDPAEPKAVLRALERISQEDYAGAELEPVAILTTHKHWDHAAGNAALKRAFPRIAVHGSEIDCVSACTHPLRDMALVTVGKLRLQALLTPGHTKGSMCYMLHGPTAAVFTGDTLFCGGCGAPFEGSAEQLCAAFAKLWRLSPTKTLLFPGHEYALAILPQYFSGAMPMPELPTLYAKLCSVLWRCKQLRSAEPPVPTAPMLLTDEMVINANFAPLRHAADNLVQAWKLHRCISAAPPMLPPLIAHPVSVNRFDSSPQLVCCACDDEMPSEPGSSVGGFTGSFLQPSDVEIQMGAVEPSAADQESVCNLQTAIADGGVAAGGEGFRLADLTDHSQGIPTGEAVESSTTESYVMVERRQLERLEKLLGDRQAASALLHRACSCVACPVGAGLASARIHHGELPRSGSTIQQLITQTDTQAAFELLECKPGLIDRHTLHRAITSPLLAEQPLVLNEADALLDVVGYDAHGMVSLERFNARLGILPAPTEPQPPAGCCKRSVSRLARLFHRRNKQTTDRRYELGEQLSDGQSE